MELTGNCFWYVAPQSLGDTRLGTPGELWIIPTPWVKVVPDAKEYVKAYQVSGWSGSAVMAVVSAWGTGVAFVHVCPESALRYTSPPDSEIT